MLVAGAIGLQVAVLARANRRAGKRRQMAAIAAGLAAGAACLAWPRHSVALLSAAVCVAINGTLLSVFARSLLPGRVAVATALAQRIHGTLTPRRLDYTRAVTRLWAGFFAAELCACAMRTMVPAALGGPLLGNLSEAPLAACLFAAEMIVRAWWFRGEQSGGIGDMLRAYRTPAGLPHRDRVAP